MARISEAAFDSFLEVLTAVEGMNGYNCLEEAAQDFTSLMYNQFEESIVLVRLFATCKYGALPWLHQEFAKSLARDGGCIELLHHDTPCLTLLASSGERSEWNDRRHSRGHVTIPLVSSAFIDSIPMMSRLLRQLGVDLTWLDGQDLSIAENMMGQVSGTFFVQDAASAIDSKGRKIIAAQDFVERCGVKTVFGMGGAYSFGNGDRFLTTIVFARESIGKSQADRFAMLVSGFKGSTLELSVSNNILRESPPAPMVFGVSESATQMAVGA